MLTKAPSISSNKEQFGDGVDFVGLVLDGHLCQGQMVLGGPGTDHVQRPQVVAADLGAAQGLAVDGNLLQPQTFPQGPHPIGKAVAKEPGRQPSKEAFEGVMGRNAVGQSQEGAQPVLAFAAKQSNLLPVAGPADDGAQGDGHDVRQEVELAAVDTGVGQFAKMLEQGKVGG
jgi:hypothetical protein